MNKNNENYATHKSEINPTMAFTQSLPASLKHITTYIMIYRFFILIFLFIAFLENNINAQNVNISFESLKNEETQKDILIDEYNSMTDSDLLKNGFYKVLRKDSIFYFLQDKQIVKYIDFGNIEKVLTEKAIKEINILLDSIQIHYRLSTARMLYNSNTQKNNNLLFSLNTKEQQESKSYISENNYYSFPKNWFSSLSNDNFRITPGFNIAILYLVNRGYYFRLKNTNPLLTNDFLPDKYIKQIVNSKDSLSVCISFLRENQTILIMRDKLDFLLDSISNSNDFKLANDKVNFSDNFSIVSFAYYPFFKTKAQIDKLNFAPILEIIFSLDKNNKMIVISTGGKYNLYNFKNIEFIQKIMD